MEVKAYAVREQGSALEPMTIERRAPGPEDVLVELMYCGICHTDLVVANNETGIARYPVVPGHEMVGRVVEAGASVTDLQVGDVVGVGCIIDSCRHCQPCLDDEEQYCDEGFFMSFNAVDRAGEPTHGGYSSHYTVHQHYALKIPDGLDPAAAAPLLCGGITVYTPLKRGGAGPGKKVGVLGLGGLGHLAVKFASAMGAHTVMLTSSPDKAADAEKLGASEVIVTTDADALQAHAGSFDMIVNTVSGSHNADAYLPLLKRGGAMRLVGAPSQPLEIMAANLLVGDKSLSGSLIGGIAGTREMLDFCAEHGIGAEIEIIPIEAVNEAWQRIENNDVKYRFVIDLSSLQ